MKLQEIEVSADTKMYTEKKQLVTRKQQMEIKKKEFFLLSFNKRKIEKSQLIFL